MAVLDAKLPAWQATTKALSVTKAEAKALEGKAPLVIDGGGLGSGTRVLLKNQTKTEQNGLFEVTANETFAGTGKFAGSGSFAKGEGWTLSRTADADSSGEVTEGMLVQIEDGETNQRTSWIQRSPGPIEVGVSAQTFEALSALPGGQITKGELENTYVAPLIKEAVIDNSKIEGKAEIDVSKLNLTAGVEADDLAISAKELAPQLIEAGKRKINFGSVEVEWEAGKNNSKEVEVEHGLGVIPQAVVGNFGFNKGFIALAATGAYTATKFLVQGATISAPGAPAKSTFKWMAIG